MGSTDYYQALMPARELVTGIRPASELDEWASMGIEERMQRELNWKRIRSDIAPYVANAEDRFFGSLIVLVWKGQLHFEPLSKFRAEPPRAHAAAVEKMGFVTIDGGNLIALDGAHRLMALEEVIKDRSENKGVFAAQVPNDEISVIFIAHESDEKTRRIFSKVNRYAKPTSRGDNIITDEDDTAAIIARWLLRDDDPLGRRSPGAELPVEWKHNTLAARSTKLTTISVVFESVRLILREAGSRYDPKSRPADEVLEETHQRAEKFWVALLGGIEAYRVALDDLSSIPAMRQPSEPYSLLFKPAVQLALIEGLFRGQRLGLDLKEAVARANGIDWRFGSDMWQGVIVNRDQTINPYSEARDRSARLIAYLIAADRMPTAEIETTRRLYNKARGYDFENPDPDGQPEELPNPVNMDAMVRTSEPA